MAGKASVSTYFAGAVYGAFILIVLMYLLKVLGLAGNPGFVNTYHAVFGEHFLLLDHFTAALLFAISGGIWGIVFRLVPNPTPLKGMVFGLLPSLWLWTVVVPAVGGAFFNSFALKGILMPLLFNCVIWGSFVGWYVQRKQN
ncbi:hypothetical protein [Fodinibius sediminis]|uniref:Uncharacterized protein n=1 Tax=Fodinibius sediminis TaxID=1214077 RepID=A0A521CZH8_9BACT|nr:hypothetical protein [Fodinibius sediminis]SMO64808.1 hypothetical protein SAMN06265218_10842 [Fodinibius sediminis]